MRGRGWCWRRIRPSGGVDAFWLVGGRLVDWGPLAGGRGRAGGRTAAALAARRVGPGELGAHVPPDEVDEIRIVAGYWHRTGHAAAGARPGAEPRSASGVRRSASSAANGSSTTVGLDLVGADGDRPPGRASRRTSASAIGPSAGDTVTLPPARQRVLEREFIARLRRAAKPQAAEVAIGLAAVVQPRDRLLADVAALRERDRAFVEAGLLGDHAVVEVDAVARAAALDPQALGGRLRHRPAPASPSAARSASVSAASHSRSMPTSVRIARGRDAVDL